MRVTKNRFGQGLAEFGLVLPLLVVILLSMLEFGWYFYYLATVNNACRLGARLGAVGGGNNNAAVTTAVSNALGYLAVSMSVSILEFTRAQVSAFSPGVPPDVSAVAANRTNGDYLVVRAAIPYNSLTQLINLNTIAGISNIKDSAAFPCRQ